MEKRRDIALQNQSSNYPRPENNGKEIFDKGEDQWLAKIFHLDLLLLVVTVEMELVWMTYRVEWNKYETSRLMLVKKDVTLWLTAVKKYWLPAGKKNFCVENLNN